MKSINKSANFQCSMFCRIVLSLHTLKEMQYLKKNKQPHLSPKHTSFEFIWLNTTKSIRSVIIYICIKYIPFFSGIPSVSVTYSAIWGFGEVITSTCLNISSQLDNLQELLEETLAKNCQMLKMNATVQFTHSFLAFQVYLSI